MSSTIGRLILIPKIDLAEFPLSLSAPTAGNCGGYILPSASGVVYAYSPIDLAIAGLEAKRNNMIVTDLFQFFYSRRNTPMSSDHDIYLGIELYIGIRHLPVGVHVLSVANWRVFSGLSATLHKNAPLTFKE